MCNGALSIRYRGRDYQASDIQFVQQLIDQNPDLTRRGLSAKLCEAWNWVQANGALRDMVCRGFMLQLHRAGLILLPPKSCSPANPLARPRKPQTRPDMKWEPLASTLADLGPLRIAQVRRSPHEKLFGQLMQTHHYLGYTQPVGEHLKYLVWARDIPIACLAWSSAPRRLGCRDRYIGWPPAVRRRNIHRIAYNTRFVILPWARTPHLASHLLGRITRRISADWRALYHHPIYLLETFVDPERFCGACYRAANWIELGATTGRGKEDQTHRPNRSLKVHWVYPLSRDFRERLQAADA